MRARLNSKLHRAPRRLPQLRHELNAARPGLLARKKKLLAAPGLASKMKRSLRHLPQRANSSHPLSLNVSEANAGPTEVEDQRKAKVQPTRVLVSPEPRLFFGGPVC